MGTTLCPDASSAPSGENTSSPFPTSIPAIYVQAPDPFPAMADFVSSSAKRYHLDLFTIQTTPKSRPRTSSKPSEADFERAQNDQAAQQRAIPTSSPYLAANNVNDINNVIHNSHCITFRDAFSIYLSTRDPKIKKYDDINEKESDDNNDSDGKRNNNTNQEIRAIFVGTRRTDPHGSNLTHFDRTDHGWPDFMRIHPVIDWRLRDIWTFLRAEELQEPISAAPPPPPPPFRGLSDPQNQPQPQTPHSHIQSPMQSPLPYCSLYDQGYTSLGGVNDTVPNPTLRYIDSQGTERFRPAFELFEDEDERLGRF